MCRAVDEGARRQQQHRQIKSEPKTRNGNVYDLELAAGPAAFRPQAQSTLQSPGELTAQVLAFVKPDWHNAPLPPSPVSPATISSLSSWEVLLLYL